MPDTPYLHIYQIDYVNMTRDVSETVRHRDRQVISGGGGRRSHGRRRRGRRKQLHPHRQQHLRNRFWETLEKNIKDMLRETDKLLPEGSSETFVRSRGASQSASTGGAGTTTTHRANVVTGGVVTQQQPGDLSTAQANESIEQRLTFREAASVIVNPETGVVSVRATSRQHEKVQQFLDQVTGASRRQVMIEATVVEVTLNDNYQAGIDWSSLAINGLGYTITQAFVPPDLPSTPNSSRTRPSRSTTTTRTPRSAAPSTTTVKLLDTFGRTRVLSSPKLMAMNNQTAVLKVVDNNVYFSVKADTVTNQTTSTTTFTTTAERGAGGIHHEHHAADQRGRHGDAQRAPDGDAHHRPGEGPQPVARGRQRGEPDPGHPDARDGKRAQGGERADRRAGRPHDRQLRGQAHGRAGRLAHPGARATSSARGTTSRPSRSW